MFATTEARWFYQGAVPLAIWRWFAASGREVAEPPPRVDYYLRTVDGDGLGIKLREGRIEVKQRYGQQNAVHFGARAVGIVEHWRKWSFELNDARSLIVELGGDPSLWIGVRKERKLRMWRRLADGNVVNVPDGSAGDHGCGWEVTQIGLAGDDNPWWSIGFEAFGEEAGRGEMMKVIAEHILTVDNAPILELKDSYGYPKWLQGVF